MSDEEVRITLRLPARLRDRLQASAEETSRSMNGEIVARLDGSFAETVTPQAVVDAYALVEALRAQLEAYAERLRETEKQMAEDHRRIRDEYLEKTKQMREEILGQAQTKEERLRDRLDRRYALQFEKLENRRQKLQERAERLDEREKDLDAAIQRVIQREQEFAGVIASMKAAFNGGKE